MRFILLLVLLFVIFSCNKNTSIESINSSPLQLIKDSFDVGIVPQDTIIKGYFIVKNLGNKSINYTNIVVDCNCTNFDKFYVGDSIGLNEIDTINFTLNTAGMTSNFVIEKCIRLETNTKPDLHRFYVFGKIK